MFDELIGPEKDLNNSYKYSKENLITTIEELIFWYEMLKSFVSEINNYVNRETHSWAFHALLFHGFLSSLILLIFVLFWIGIDADSSCWEVRDLRSVDVRSRIHMTTL